MNAVGPALLEMVDVDDAAAVVVVDVDDAAVVVVVVDVDDAAVVVVGPKSLLEGLHLELSLHL